MRQRLRGVLLFSVAAPFLSVFRCSEGYFFVVVGTVRSAVNGQPIPGARVAVNTYGEKDRPDLDQAATQTDEAGAFATEQFYVSVSAFGAGRPTWYLKVEKEGFLPEFVEIKPRRAPEQHSSTSTIVPIISLRPAK